MDLLKEENGYSLIEALVSISILGIIIIITAILFTKLLSGNSIYSKSEALILAKNEIEYVRQNKIFSDTAYNNSDGNMLITRTIKQEDSLYKVIVSVSNKSKEKQLISMNILIGK